MLCLVRQGNKYGPEYTRMLRRMAMETSGLDTIVLGDGEDADIRLEFNWPGWWSKLEAFRPDLEGLRPFLFVDLDSFILKDVSSLIRDEPWICREWWTRGGQTIGKVQSSVMVIPKDTSEIWETWTLHPLQWMGLWGDQAFLEKFKWNFIQDEYPDYVGSYKLHNKEKPETRIVTFHGKPKPPDAKGWPEEIWWNYQKP